MDQRLHVFSPKTDRQSAFLSLNNSCFSFWKNNWQKIYREANAESAFKIDDYYRQDLIVAITRDTEVVAMYATSRFNTLAEATRQHTYFKFYDEGIVEWLGQRDIVDLMSVEFMTVAEHLRGQKGVASLIRVLGSIGGRLLIESNAQALIATARTDVAAAKVAYEMGYECIRAGTMQRNFPCDLIACRRENLLESPDPRVRAEVESLWANREDSRDMIRPLRNVA